MINLTENITINARTITTIKNNFINKYKELKETSIILPEDLIHITSNATYLCKTGNITTINNDFFINDNIGDETDQILLPQTDIKQIQILRFNKNIGGKE